MVHILSLQPEIKKLAEKHRLSFVTLFGSQARGNVHPDSDIDIAVIGKDDHDKMRLMADFSDLLKREDVEVVNLAHASPTLMHSVVKDGVLLYERENGEFLKWKLYAIWVWLDTAWLRRLRDKKLVEWAKTV